MDAKVLYALSYGVFMLATKSGDKVNGCITNTCIQVANSPTRVALSVLNNNYTCELLKESGICTLSILDQTVSYDIIKHFGMQSGRDVDKMAELKLPTEENGIPYLVRGACAVLCLKIVGSMNLGSHTLFMAVITDGWTLNTNEPLTYSYYQNNIKPKPDNSGGGREIVGWRCKICGYIYSGPELPEDYTCPMCGHPAEDFEPLYR